MSQGLDLNSIYSLRSNFTIIGLTGKTKSGCSEVADQLVKGFNGGLDFTDPKELFKAAGGKFLHNSFRKHRIIYEFASHNFKPFTEIKYKDVITLFLLKYSISKLKEFLISPYLSSEFYQSSIPSYDFESEIKEIFNLSSEFEDFSKSLRSIELDQIKLNGKWDDFYSLFFSQEFKNFSNSLHAALGKNADLDNKGRENTGICYHKTFQIICNNLRKSGNPFDSSIIDANKIFTIAEVINKIIKSHRENNKLGATQIVINSLKNPLEIMFFKQRYSGFYSVAINRDEDDLWGDVIGKFTMTKDKKIVSKLVEEEYNGGENKEFYKQRIKECLQLADIHISFLSPDKAEKKNKPLFEKKEGSKDISSPYFSWRDQLLKYVSLIYHPGLIAPSSEERCMQLAYTAKHNSGCISRQVGAAITDENYSVKSIGWNNTPEGQVPCALRKLQDLLYNENDFEADFTNYERGEIGKEFRQALLENFIDKYGINKNLLKGRNICYCFKTIKNSISEGINQVHTRSLHAEENAFLQISKYGGQGLKNGILFSTASPCELCSKKAYQIGITVIYYIDPYPGISKPHILSAGDNKIEVRLFNGAIGSAYHRLYHPMMNYKDEISLLLDQKIIDLTSKYKNEKDEYKMENDNYKEENEKLRARIRELEIDNNNSFRNTKKE